ncbi:MAG: efflux RND transporter periplasmic adaptor subunit [Candidatus Paceibacterota bacterium]
MIFINKILNFLKKKKYIYGIAIAVLIIGAVFVFRNKNHKDEVIIVERGDFINQVSVSGKVVAGSDVGLGFSQGGRISLVKVKVGDVVSTGSLLSGVENGDLRADLAQKEALLEKEQANLRSLELGTRPEQITIAESSVLSAQTVFSQARQGVVNSINDAYTKSDDAIKNKIDQFFRNPLSLDPYIILSVSDNNLILDVNQKRVLIGKTLSLWEGSILTINSETNLDKYILEAENNLNQLKSFLAKISLITNNPDVTYNSGSILSSWKADTSTARLQIDTVISNLSSAVTTYRNAKSELTTKQNNLKLEQAGATKEEIEAKVAEVKSAQASVDSARANLQKTLITAPFDGIITKIDAKVGEVASANVSLIQMMSVGTFQIESYVPEVNIAQIKLGNEAKVTLDAYGESIIFFAKVVSIDPAETIRDGVSTYKIKLQFSDKDDRIKSGMTANVSITVFSKQNVLVVPGGVVFDKNGKKFIQVKTGNKIIDKEVVLGSSSSLGQVEIISGLEDGEMVVLIPQIE